MRVVFPPHLSPSAANDLYLRLEDAALQGSIELDFCHSTWMPPFSALLASSQINRIKAKYPSVRLTCSNFCNQSYGAHIGFFRSFGLEYGNWPGQATGNNNYLPITLMDCNRVRTVADDQGRAVGVIVDRLTERIAGILSRSNQGMMFESLQYSLREIMRNVVEHSETDRLAYCAQYWPTNGRVEVGILDWGVGLAASLRLNPELQVPDDATAIHLALMPGVTGKSATARKMQGDGPWTNSGYGLYMTSRLCRNGGSFLLGSGGSAVVLAGNGVTNVKWNSPGTAVKLEIYVPRLQELQAMLGRFREEAQAFNKTTPLNTLTASLASRALLRDFEKI